MAFGVNAELLSLQHIAIASGVLSLEATALSATTSLLELATLGTDVGLGAGVGHTYGK
jgi:hypothetical protein